MTIRDFGRELMDNEYELIAESELVKILPDILQTGGKYWKYSGVPAAQILISYYGLGGGEKQTLKAIGQRHGGRSVERMRQVKNRAMRILMHPQNFARITRARCRPS